MAKKGTRRVNVPAVLKSYSRSLLGAYEDGTRMLVQEFERGAAREKAVFDFLSKRLPARYGVGEGFVIDGEGGQSDQCDVVIYDRERTPCLSVEPARTIWPFESVYGVVQVKSKLTRAQLKDAVENIASFKRLSRLTNRLSEGRGARTLVGELNPPLGILIAHQVSKDVAPDTGSFAKVVECVPREHQLDAYCIVSGAIGFRGNGPEGEPWWKGPELVHSDYGDGALAAFLLFLSSALNNLVLGDANLFHYLGFLEVADP
jgi:hypothetical protein